LGDGNGLILSEIGPAFAWLHGGGPESTRRRHGIGPKLTEIGPVFGFWRVVRFDGGGWGRTRTGNVLGTRRRKANAMRLNRGRLR